MAEVKRVILEVCCDAEEEANLRKELEWFVMEYPEALTCFNLTSRDATPQEEKCHFDTREEIKKES